MEINRLNFVMQHIDQVRTGNNQNIFHPDPPPPTSVAVRIQGVAWYLNEMVAQKYVRTEAALSFI